MKKTKLLPLVGIGAVCTTITPLAILTGCNNNNNNGYVNALSRYLPKGIEQHEYVSPMTSEEATQEYGKVLVGTQEKPGNPNLFKEDFYWYVSNELRSLQEYAVELAKADTPVYKERIYSQIVNKLTRDGYYITVEAAKRSVFTKIGRTHDIKITDVSAEWPKPVGTTVNAVKISFKLEYKYFYEDHAVSGLSSITDTEEMVGTTEFYQVPYLLIFNPTNRLWAITPNTDIMWDPSYYGSNSWHISYNAHITDIEKATGTSRGDYEIVTTRDDDFYWNELEIPNPYSEDVLRTCMEEDSSCYSWYMWNVPGKDGK